MKKYIILIILLHFVLLPLKAYNKRENLLRRGSAVSFTINYGYTTPLSSFLTEYGYNWGDLDYSIAEFGTIESQSLQNQFSTQFSMGINFSRGFGLSFSATFFKQDLDLSSEYAMFIDWWDGSSDRLDGVGLEPGSVSIIPLSANLFYKFNLTGGMSLRVHGGISLYLLNYKLFSSTGWGAMYEDAEIYAPDWFVVDVGIEGTDKVWGGNVGFDFERRMGRNLSLVFGGQYYYAPAQQYRWSVDIYNYYEGQMGYLEMFEAPDIHDPEEIFAEVNLSFFRFFGGLRIYF